MLKTLWKTAQIRPSAHMEIITVTRSGQGIQPCSVDHWAVIAGRSVDGHAPARHKEAAQDPAQDPTTAQGSRHGKRRSERVPVCDGGILLQYQDRYRKYTASRQGSRQAHARPACGGRGARGRGRPVSVRAEARPSPVRPRPRWPPAGRASLTGAVQGGYLIEGGTHHERKHHQRPAQSHISP